MSKYYVVWEGGHPGIYPSWEECKAQVEGHSNAKFKGFNTKEEAVKAFRGDLRNELGILKAIASHEAQENINPLSRFPEIRLDAIAVDGACSGNPGPVEYRGVRVGTGEELFRVGPLNGGTNNIGEYLALVHALALLDRQGDRTTPVYADSRTSLAWLRRHGHASTLKRTPFNSEIFNLLERADRWVQSHLNIPNKVLKWDTERWGEIPADFGRKS